MSTTKADPFLLKKYLITHGIKFEWFAQKLGLEVTYFYHVLAGRRNIAEKHWEPIARLTKGEVIYGHKHAE